MFGNKGYFLRWEAERRERKEHFLLKVRSKEYLTNMIIKQKLTVRLWLNSLVQGREGYFVASSPEEFNKKNRSYEISWMVRRCRCKQCTY